MRPLKKPNMSIEDVFTTCVQSYQDKLHVERLLSVIGDVCTASIKFDSLAKEHKTHRINDTIAARGMVTTKELIDVYSNKLLAKAGGRKYYEQLLAMPINSVCPLCGAREVSTLDHYIAKSISPSLVVTPTNLVAACRDCNTDRLVQRFTCTEDETLHPYYDNIEGHRWLYCDVQESDPISFLFSIKMIDTADSTLFHRILKHFQVFKLGQLYATRAATEITSYGPTLKRLHEKIGKQAVCEHIQEDLISYESISLNSWNTAFYRGLLDSEWFLNKWVSDMLDTQQYLGNQI